MANTTLHERYNDDPELLAQHVMGPLEKKGAFKSETDKKKFKKWFMQRIKHKITFDPTLIWYCYKAYKKLSSNNDFTIVITGPTGSGKSTLATQIMCWIIPEFNKTNIISTLQKYVYAYRDRAVSIRKNMIKNSAVYRPEPDGLIMDEGNEIRSDESNKRRNRLFRRLFPYVRP